MVIPREEPGARSARARGCLLAAACGDALGAPFEGARRVDGGELAEWAASERPLRYTDDTAMLLTLAEYLADAAGAFDESELVHRFASAWQDEPGRGYGAGPPRIFQQVLTGQSWQDAAEGIFPGGSFGNGGAMRVASVGLLDLPLDDIASLARRSARVTHAHPLALDGAAAQAVAVALAFRSPIDTDEFLAAIGDRVQAPEFSDRLRTVRTLVSAAAEPTKVAGRLGNDLRALTSVPTALTAFLREPDDLPAALTFAVRIGGDTDTIAAMTGAVAGARLGDTVLPGSWLARLENRDRLSNTADRLASDR